MKILVLLLTLFLVLVPTSVQAAPLICDPILSICVDVGVTLPPVLPLPSATAGPTAPPPAPAVSSVAPQNSQRATASQPPPAATSPARTSGPVSASNTPTGQEGATSATVSSDTQPEPEVVIDVEDPDVLPDSPGEFLVVGFGGLLLGALICSCTLYLVYRFGRKQGEKATLREFLSQMKER